MTFDVRTYSALQRDAARLRLTSDNPDDPGPSHPGDCSTALPYDHASGVLGCVEYRGSIAPALALTYIVCAHTVEHLVEECPAPRQIEGELEYRAWSLARRVLRSPSSDQDIRSEADRFLDQLQTLDRS